MHVTLSVDALAPNLSGIGRYCWELANGLLGDQRIDTMAFSYGNAWVGQPADLLRHVCPRPRRRPLRLHFDRWWRHGRHHPRIYHSPNYFLPDWAEGGVATVHDLSVFHYPETHPDSRVEAFERNFENTIARAGLVLTDCEWMRKEVLAFTGIEPTKVIAVPLGVSPAFRPRAHAEIAEALSPYGLPIGDYGLCVSTLEPRKRIDELLHAWRDLPRSIRDKHPLVLAGGDGWRNESLTAHIQAGKSEGWLRHLGYVPESILPALYAGARTFAYPSRYEGFGLPPLEAMACGVPTLVSTGTCLEEVTAAGAARVDASDTDAMRDVLVRLLEPGQWRDDLASAGVQVASRYTWATCVDQTIAAYEILVKKGF